MWKARCYQSLPRVVEDYPDARWMLLTLTVSNCAIGELGETLNRTNAAFQRLKERKEFRPVAGWIRTTQYTRDRVVTAHPYFYPLPMVPPGLRYGQTSSRPAFGTQLLPGATPAYFAPAV